MFAAKVFLLCFFATFVAACTDSGAPSSISPATGAGATPSKPGKPAAIKVAVILKSFTNPFFVEMAKGARQAQAETGIELEIKTSTPDTSAEQQIRLVNSQIKAGVNAIVISPVDTRLLVPTLKAAHDAGIKIVNIDERLNAEALTANGLYFVPYIGVNSEQGAYLAAKFIADKIGHPTEVAIVGGVSGTATAIERQQGAQRAFQENAHLRLVPAGAANWKADEAYELARRLFKAHPRIGAVYCANDLMAIGVIKYLQESRNSKVLVGGFDALEEARGAIGAGQMAVTVDQRAAQQGYLGVTSALKLLRGEAVPKVLLVETQLVSAGGSKP
jgi:ribose transport system substrate-binding protein